MTTTALERDRHTPVASHRQVAVGWLSSVAPQPSRLLWLALVAVACVIGGWLAVSAPPIALAAGAVGVVITLVVLRRPELGALVILCLVATVPRGTLFERGIPIGGGTLKVTDVLMVLTFGSWLLAASRRPDRYRLPPRSVLAALLLFLVVALFGLATAKAQASSLKLGLLELRPLLSYLLVIPLVSCVTSVRQLERGLVVLFAACGVSGFEVIWKYVHGQGSAASFSGGAIRIDAVFLYPLVAVIWCVVLAAFKPSRQLRNGLIVLGAVSTCGLFFTFQRGAWLAAVIGVTAALALLPGIPRRRVLIMGMPVLIALVGAVTVLNAASSTKAGNLLGGAVNRFASLGSYSQDVSNEYRLAEWGEAFNQIDRHPLTGIGLGNSITFWSPMYDQDTKRLGGTYSTYYIHDSYIWLALKLGIPGLVAFLLLIATTLAIGLSRYRSLREPRTRKLLIGAIVAIITVLALSFSGPHLTVDNATPLMAAMLSVVLIVARLGDDGRDPEEPSTATHPRRAQALTPA